eukprot:3297609-Prymnesium_polylepis.1
MTLEKIIDIASRDEVGVAQTKGHRRALAGGPRAVGKECAESGRACDARSEHALAEKSILAERRGDRGSRRRSRSRSSRSES